MFILLTAKRGNPETSTEEIDADREPKPKRARLEAVEEIAKETQRDQNAEIKAEQNEVMEVDKESNDEGEITPQIGSEDDRSSPNGQSKNAAKGSDENLKVKVEVGKYSFTFGIIKFTETAVVQYA